MKIRLIGLLSAAALFCQPAAAQEDNAQRLAKTLTDQYGAEVNVKIDAASCEIKYSEVIIEEEETEYVPSPTDPNEVTVQTKKITTTIPATSPLCEQTDSFYGLPQYKITDTSPNRFLAQIYNLSTVNLADGFTAQKFREEMSVVPQLGIVSADKLQIKDAVYTQKDKSTGLKTEIANLKDFIMEQKISKEDKVVKFKLDTQLDTLNVVLPFFSLQIPSQRHSSELEYQMTDDKDFDFAQMLQNLELLQSSKSAAAGKGIRVHTDFADAGLVFDFTTRGDAHISMPGYIDFIGDFKLQNISFIGDYLEASKQPKSIELEYTVKNLDVKSVARIAQLQQEVQKDEPSMPDNKEMAAMLDSLIDKAKIVHTVQVNFAQANMRGTFEFERKNGYLFGTGTLSVNNLYNIFPEQKQCFNNPQASTLPACSDDNFAILSGFAEYIDITKNNSESVYTFNEKGIFKGSEKIGDPIELNFEKMLQEEEEAEQKIDAENEAVEQTQKQIEAKTEAEVETVTETEKEGKTETEIETETEIKTE